MDIYYVDCATGKLLKDNATELCHTFTALPFRMQKITLKTANAYSNKVMQNAKARLNGINFNPANSSGVVRDNNEIRLKAFCGLIVEQLCFDMLCHYNKNPKVQIELDNSNNSFEQIDLKIRKNWLDHNNNLQSIVKTVEIRSSFPFKAIEQVVARDFDILGAYKNDVKIAEIEKDFYLRFLFALNYQPQFLIKNNNAINYSKTTTNVLKRFYFDEDLNLKQDMTIYFIGGATNAMMLDDSIAYNGSMRSANFNQANNAQYKKIKVRNALDCIAIMQMMLNVITTEAASRK